MSAPKYIDDGSFKTPVQTGPDEASYPFVQNGEKYSFEIKRKYLQDQDYYFKDRSKINRNRSAAYGTLQSQGVFADFAARTRRQTNPSAVIDKITTLLGDAYLVDESEAAHVGNGLVEFTRTYAGLPNSRREGTTIAYSFQTLSLSAFADGEAEIAEVTVTLGADVLYEYFLQKPKAYQAPRIALVNGKVIYYGNWKPSYPSGTEIVAQDSEVGIHKGGIYYRKTIIITWP